MSKKMFTAGFGGGSKPAKPKPLSNPNVAIPIDYLPPAPDSQPESPETIPQDDQPTYGPENPPPPFYGGPGPVFSGIINTNQPVSSPSTRPENPPPKKVTVSNPQVAVPGDFIQAEATPDISALDLENSWSSEFNLHQLRMENDCELVRELETAFRHEGMFRFYLDDPKACLKNFAEYGWDEESDRLAEEYIEKYVEEIKLQTARREQRVLRVMQAVIEDLSNDRYESVIAIDLDTGDKVFQRPGWRDFVLLQEENRDIVQGRDVGLFHNHPDYTAASKADLDTAFWLGARFLTIVTPSGTRYVYFRGEREMELAATIGSRHIVAAPSWREDVESLLAYWSQVFAEHGNPAEMVMLEDEPAPKASDYLLSERPRRLERPTIDQSYIRRNDERILVIPNPLDPFVEWRIRKSTESARDHGFYRAGVNLLHWLGDSGREVSILVDQLVNDLPRFRRHIIDSIGFNLGDHLPLTGNPESKLKGTNVYESERYSVFAYTLDWMEVGKGKGGDDDIYGFPSELPVGYELKADLEEGIPPEGVSQREYDWFLAVNKFFYYASIAVVLDRETHEVEVALQIYVRDRYAWYINEGTGRIDSIMGGLEASGVGQNFPIFGQSSIITGRFNLEDKTTKNSTPYYGMKDIDWNINK